MFKLVYIIWIERMQLLLLFLKNDIYRLYIFSIVLEFLP